MGGEPDAQQLRQLLKLHRARAGLTQRDLAACAGISERGLQDIERGVSIPHRKTVRRLMAALGLRGEERRLFERAARPSVQATPGTSGVASVHLPVNLTSFVGRRREASDIADCLGRARLLTLTGAGGIGKTRLALEVAARVTPNFPDGVWFVSLASVSASAQVSQAVASVLGVFERSTSSLIRAIGSGRVLLVLDNCEHVAEDAARLAADLLYACPSLVLLATSREPLRLSGELIWPVPPLSLPPTDQPIGPESAAAADSVALLCERARAVRPNFALDADTLPAALQLCARLAGVPLAIELAAARLRSLSVRAILNLLDASGGLDVLDAGPRDASPRHQSLRTAIAWSVDLLSPDEHALFCRIAVFRGCGLDSLNRVCIKPADGPGTSSVVLHRIKIDALEGVRSLIDKSLLRMEEDEAGEPWYVLLEPIRDFALERLECSGEAHAVRRRHVLECVRVVEHIQQRSTHWPGLPSFVDRELLDRLERQHANCREALAWCLEEGYAEPCFRLATGLWWFWAMRGYTTEGRTWMSRILERFPDRNDHWRHTLLRAKLLEAAGRLAIFQNDLSTARRLLEQSLRSMDQLEDNVGLFSVLEGLGLVCHQLGDNDAARRFLERGLAVAHTFGGMTRIADGLYNLGNLAHEEGDATQARAYLEQSAHLCEQAGESRSLALVLLALGGLDQDEGQVERARQRTEQALEAFERCEDIRGASLALANLGTGACVARDFTAAGAYLVRSLSMAQQMDEPAGVARVLESFAVFATARGESSRAVRLAGAAATLREKSHVEQLPGPRRRLASELEPARNALGRLAQETFRAGRGLSLSEAVAEALALAHEPPLSGTGAGSHPLSRRQMEVVRLIGRGLTNRQIAEALIIGEATVATHVMHIRRNLEVTSRTQIAAWAATSGLLDQSVWQPQSQRRGKH